MVYIDKLHCFQPVSFSLDQNGGGGIRLDCLFFEKGLSIPESSVFLTLMLLFIQIFLLCKKTLLKGFVKNPPKNNQIHQQTEILGAPLGQHFFCLLNLWGLFPMAVGQHCNAELGREWCHLQISISHCITKIGLSDAHTDVVTPEHLKRQSVIQQLQTGF